MAEEGEAAVGEPAPEVGEPAPDVAVAPAPSEPFPTELSAAQLGEVWAAPTDDAALELLARCLQLPDEYEEEPRISIWLDMLFKWLDFGKLNELTPVKALTSSRLSPDFASQWV